MEELFHPIVREWFERTFGRPTPAQAQGWPAIGRGRHTLISAPTGSGKTLAAFLVCIDRLLRAAIEGRLEDVAHVVYVSPLKALSNDVHKNLAVPLQEILALARRRDVEVPEIRVAVRTGDTPSYERRVTARRPPHIWITTPESLYILLTSPSGRRGLAGVRTLILDEIHAVIDDKRGSHLALSVERLCRLAAAPVTRIGLSATQRPIEEVARFLVGTDAVDASGSPACSIVDIGHRRRMDIEIVIPDDELGPVASNALWDETVGRIAGLIEGHRTTLVFVNTRRLVERVSHQLSQKIGADQVAAHHGSLSRRTRLEAEERLKKAEIRACVATSSLELGIDVGAVELVCQVGSPRSISTLLQRVGRSGHWLGGIPKGRIFPLTRDELIECAALVHALRRGDLESLSIPPWPLDVLAQQVVAMCSAEDWPVEDLFHLARRAWPYRGLPREKFDTVLEMLSQGVARRLGRRSALLHHDRTNQVIRGRRGARIAALTGAGAIPDTADYEVIVDPEGTRVGTVNEDFVVESSAGDVFLLGNTSWRVLRVEMGRLRVEDAHGQAPLVPFWLGEAPSRSRELSEAVSDLRQGVEERMADREGCHRWLEEIGLSAAGAAQAQAYLEEGRRVLGCMPTRGRIVAERFFDESGGMQLVIHSPFGGRINRAWGLALRKRFCRQFDFELQASATDDGINLSLGPQHSFPLEDIFRFLPSRGIEEVLEQAVLASPIFTTRWRWTLTRSLTLSRMSGGRRVPMPLQRMRADDMLAAVFPAQAGCQDNRTGPDLPVPDHPLIFETLRDCLTEALDAEGLRELLAELESGRIDVSARDTPSPSVFSHQILNAMPYAFLDDAPLEERRARAVILRRVLPDRADDLGRLDPEAIRSAAEDAWPAVRDAEELHDLLLGVVLFPESEAGRLPADAPRWFDDLVCHGRAMRAGGGGLHYWVSVERRSLVSSMPGVVWDRPDMAGERETAAMASPAEPPLVTVVRGWVELSGPLTAPGLAQMLGIDRADALAALAHLEGEGLVLRGCFTQPGGAEEFCDRRILARIHRATIAHLRREIEPVPASEFLRFLCAWQHAAPGAQLEGDNGVLEVVEQLQGFEAAATAWEAEVLPARIRDYKPEMLDAFCLSGELVWGRWARRATQAEVPARRPGLTRTAPLGLAVREDLPWILSPEPADEQALSVPARGVLAFLRQRGASFFPEIRAAVRHLPSEVEEALWQLVAAGLVTADSFAALRSLLRGDLRRTGHPRRSRRPRLVREGRWSLLDSAAPRPENSVELRARQLLRRYGILCRELLQREVSAPPWRDLAPLLRRMEARGEIRGGRFVAGLAGEQFALPEAVDALRALRRSEKQGQHLRISACDPLNLAGIVTPGPRVPAVPGNRLVYMDGTPVAAVENGQPRMLTHVDALDLRLLDRLLDERPASAFDPPLNRPGGPES